MNKSYSRDELYYPRWLTQHLQDALETHPNAQGGVLLHSGREIRYLDERILALPWSLLTG